MRWTTLSALVCCALSQAALAANIAYPQRIELDAGYVLVHAPQITSWQDFEVIEGRAVLEGYPEGEESPLIATARFKADALPDVDRRIVTVSGLVIERITFADGTAVADDKRQLLQAAMPVAAREVPLDLVLSNLPDDVTVPDTKGIAVEPPAIVITYAPTLLVQTHGEPVAAPIEDSKLKFVVNTNWRLFTDEKQKRWYLLHED